MTPCICRPIYLFTWPPIVNKIYTLRDVYVNYRIVSFKVLLKKKFSELQN